MDLTDTNAVVSLLSGLVIVVGLIGIVVPVIPGLVLCWLGVLVWAILGEGGGLKWLILAAATIVALIGTVIKYAWTGRNLKRTGVPYLSMFAGGVLALVGFFVVPIVGLLLGFLLGIWLAERVRLKDQRLAWSSTKAAVKAVGLAMLIELGAGMMVAALWVVGLVVA